LIGAALLRPDEVGWMAPGAVSMDAAAFDGILVPAIVATLPP